MESDDYFPELLLQLTYNNNITDFAAAFFTILILLFFISVLSAAENAVSGLSQDDMNKAEESHSKRDKKVLYLSDHLRIVKSVCSMAYTIVAILVTLLCMYGSNALITTTLPLTLIISFVCTLLLWAIFKGFVPRLISGHRLKYARAMAPLLNAVVKAGTPFLKLSSTHTDHTENESFRKKQVPLANEAPNDMYEEKEMLEEIIHFYNKKTNEIMTPRTDIEAIDIKSYISDIVNIIVESGYSRIPVYEDNEDNVKGILFAKDIIPLINDPTDFAWQSIIRKPFFVPESKKIYGLLNELRTNKTHMAIVVDEFGCTSGLVTMEDIIEEIIGDISDEYDEDENQCLSLPDGSFILEGKTQLNDFFRETGVSSSDFNEYLEEAETLTGLMLAIKGTLPRRREIIDYNNYKFHILEANERLVLKVKFSIIPNHKPEKKQSR